MVPDYILVGAFARDYWVHQVAGLPPVARTLDVDIAIAVPSMQAYLETLASFDGPREPGLAFQVDGIHVDIIPYGPGLASNGILEPIAGVTLDITGLREAAAGAEEIEIEGIPLVSQH